MTKALADLCCELVQTTLGELSAQIFSALAEHGRLNLSQIYHYSSFPLKQVRSGLSVLIEHQLVTRFVVDDESPAFYHANLRAAYQLARHDNILNMVTERFGKDAGVIVGSILRSGHASIRELADAVCHVDAPPLKDDEDMDTGNGAPNGVAGGHSIRLPRFHAVALELLRAKVLVKVTPRSYLASVDLQAEMQDTIISTNDAFAGGKIHGPKKKVMFKLAMADLKRKWQDEDDFTPAEDLVAQGSTLHPHKRVKLNGHTNGHRASHDQDSDVRVSPDLVVGVNHAKCVLAMRNQRLEQLARRTLGSTTASVYRALLRILDSKIVDLDVEDDDEELVADDMRRLPSANVAEVAQMLEPLPPVIQGPDALKDETQPLELGQLLEPEEDSSDEEGPSKGVSSYRAQAAHVANVESYLSILAEHPSGFCQRSSEHGGHNEWQVNYPAITRTLMEADLDEVILSRHGKIHFRIVRVLREVGKLEEKQIGAKGMLPVKDIYTLLTQLQYDGVVECQEIPKDNSRQPGRTIYLWYIDDTRVRDQLVQRAYKTMARFLQRLRTERRRHQGIIEKVERSDVVGREEDKLAPNEKKALQQWREVEERLLGQVARMDELVALYRDFMAGDTTLKGQ